MEDQAQKLKLFREKQNKALVKKGLKPLISASEIYVPPRQTSGILSLDVALGGGWPTNRWIEIVGESSASKTTTVLHTIAVNQAKDKNYSAFWVASEPYNPEWAEAHGVDNNRVEVFEHNNMELCFQEILDAGRENVFDAIVLDSYPALIASDESDKDMEGFTVGGGARRVGQFFRKIPDTYSDDRPYVGFFINQFRDKIGGFSPYGTPTTEPGGKAKNYQFYQRVKIGRDDWIEEAVDGLGKVKVGQTVKYLITKNKAGAPQKTAVADMYFENSAKGFKPGDYDMLRDTITMAVVFKVIRRAGAWFNYTSLDNEEFKWQGRDALVEELRGKPILMGEISKLTLETAVKSNG
jgi:recombination protein RecA